MLIVIGFASQMSLATVPLKCKLPLSREKRDSYREKRESSRRKRELSREKFLVYRECTASTASVLAVVCSKDCRVLFYMYMY